MAANAPTLRLRFRLNQQTGSKSTSRDLEKATRNFGNTVIEQVGLIYADREYDRIYREVWYTLRGDVRNEIEHIARQYKRFIIGSAAARSTRGELTTAASTNRGYALEGQNLKDYPIQGTNWQKRKRRYLMEKQKRVGHQLWFQDAGDPVSLGRQMSKGSTWINMFGNISIFIRRIKSVKGLDTSMDVGGKNLTGRTAKTFGRSYGSTFGVAEIEVGAFGKISPAMLPALLSGNPSSNYPDGRKTGLIALARAADLETSYRLAGGSSVPYRPTLEPFLEFTLTRAIPFAVFNRINKGIGADTQIRNYRWR